MSKELKAFRKICKNLNGYEFTDEYKENKKLIETKLKGYEELTNRPVILYGRTHGYTQKVIDFISKNYKEVKITNLEDEKKLKALEIIKEKEVDVIGFRSCCITNGCGVEIYNQYHTQYEYQHLTQNEFETLKEALL